MKVSFSIPTPCAGKIMRWGAGKKWNGGMYAPITGAYVLRVRGSFIGTPVWEWDYKSAGEHITYGVKVFIPS